MAWVRAVAKEPLLEVGPDVRQPAKPGGQRRRPGALTLWPRQPTTTAFGQPGRPLLPLGSLLEAPLEEGEVTARARKLSLGRGARRSKGRTFAFQLMAHVRRGQRFSPRPTRRQKMGVVRMINFKARTETNTNTTTSAHVKHTNEPANTKALIDDASTT
jgi:hypothetical protein